MDENNQVIPNLPEKLSGYGYISGIVTTDNLDGATPAAFFAHQPERGMSKEIWADLPNSKLTFLPVVMNYLKTSTKRSKGNQKRVYHHR